MMDLLIGVPVIVAMVEMCKMAGLPSKFSPLLSLVLGVTLFLLFGVGETLPVMFEGIIAGLTASGLFSGTKAMVRK